MEVIKVIHGPQSDITMYINDHGDKVVNKIATDRGNDDVLDQVEFYTNLPKNARKYFPRLINYQIKEKPYSMEYEYIEGATLRQLVIKKPLDTNIKNKLTNTINSIHENVHNLIIREPETEYVNEVFFKRIDLRIQETIEMARSKTWFLNDYYLGNQKINNPLKRIIKCLEISAEYLKPEYICSTHGQLGPSHIIYKDEMMSDFTLIDVKGFNKLYDPLYDICKLEKGLAYGTEWLEDNQYEITFKIENDILYVENFELLNFDRNKSKVWFGDIIDSVLMEFDYGKGSKYRLLSLVASDIVASLPFGWKTDGEKRVAALCILLDWVATDMEEVIANEEYL
jgi:hypothetical protein